MLKILKLRNKYQFYGKASDQSLNCIIHLSPNLVFLDITNMLIPQMGKIVHYKQQIR